MYSPFTLFTGVRYTGNRRAGTLVAFISLVSISGLALGVGLLIVVLSVMNGFDKELRERILGVVPHASIHHYDNINDWRTLSEIAEQHPEVLATAPYVQLQGMLTLRTEVIPVMVYGVLPEREQKTDIIATSMTMGNLADLNADQQGILLGETIAQKLAVSVGDTVTFILPKSVINPDNGSQKIVPKLIFMQVKGIYHTATELDASLVLIHLALAQQLAETGEAVHGLRLQVKDLFRASEVAYQLVNDLPQGFYVRDWTRTHGNLFNAIQLSKNLVGLLLFIIIAVAAFNVVSTLVMVVNDKQGDIAILRTLGASTREIMTIFVVQGTMIGVFGAGIGVAIGCSLSLVVTDLVAWLEGIVNYQFLKPDVYPISYLPADLRWQDVVWVASVALGMSFIATIYPSWRAAKVQPAIALRYE